MSVKYILVEKSFTTNTKMELELTRIDYGNVGTSLANCLKLLPSDHKKQQKVAIGDLDGNLQLFSIRKSEAQVHFQTFVGKKISCLQLGGALGTNPDKIFVALENVVKGYNKKGKMFLSFDTNLTETIKCMFISGADLIVCGNHVYNHYRDCKDIGSYLCGDTIVDAVALCPNNTNRILTVLACSGRVLRVLEHCRVRQVVEVGSVPTTLHVPKNVLGDKLFCGFSDGKILLFTFNHFTGEVKQQVFVNDETIPSAITCIDTYDMVGDGRDELLVGRRDGTIQVFTLVNEDDIDIEPRQIYRECFSESISSIQGGCVYSGGFSEIVVASYAGNLFGLTTQVISVSLSDKEVIKEPLLKDTMKKSLENSKQDAGSEEATKLSLVKPQENYRLSTQILSSTISAVSMLDINDTVVLCKDTASYTISIEMPIAIHEVLLQSEPHITFLNLDENSAEVTLNDVEPTSGYAVSLTARPKPNTNRFETQIQTAEGQYGILESYIMPHIQPDCVQMKTYLIRPLSLHMRIHSFDNERPFNTLTLKGGFTHAEIHSWIEQCIPEVPERLPLVSTVELYFKNVLIGTILECKYEKGIAEFRSDNLSTISILKDFLTKEATKKRIKLEIASNINEQSIGHFIKLVEPVILNCNNIKREHTFLEALLEVDIKNDDDFNCLMPEYQSILNRRTAIEKSYSEIPAILSRYFGIITDFYIDRFKFKGIFVKDKIQDLVKVLEEYKFEAVLTFFNCVKTNVVNKEEI